ncbi:MAG: hypothetical protein QOE92_1065 [Chloroflexota bacterium]|jgi:hypothetical protein|nr:hypothetical protein [Chloroflexota bacterium]
MLRAGAATLASVISMVAAGPLTASAGPLKPPASISNFELVGHDPLFKRGMNAAAGIYDHYMYVGNRTDAVGAHAAHGGVMIVDIGNPANPHVVGEIAQPAKIAAGYTSRELRVWPEQKMLVVIYFGCSAILHACTSGSDTGLQPLQHMAFFDLSQDPANPRLVTNYQPSVTPHEMYLWVDPLRPGRALMYWTSPNSTGQALTVTDISRWREGVFPEVATFTADPDFRAAGVSGSAYDLRLHSLSLSPDGRRGYLAHLGGGFMVIDTSDLANAVANPQVHLVTPVANRNFWDNQGAHSAVPIPGTHYVFTTEEIYGKMAVGTEVFGPALGGCPWGWVRIIDIADETHPRVVSEYKTQLNDPASCAGISPVLDNFSSFASHNPSIIGDLGFLTWHSKGLQAVDLSDPTHPTSAGQFIATPLTAVVQEDPALNEGPLLANKVTAWSYPIIKDGLIYIVDIRNGIYVLRYTGPRAGEVSAIHQFEGNSNVGDGATLGVQAIGGVPVALVGPLRSLEGATSEAVTSWQGIAVCLVLLAAAGLYLRRSLRGPRGA